MQTPSSGSGPEELQDLKLAVPSCDLYCDMWPLFFHFLFKYWPDVPTPVYLLSNHLSFDDPRVITVKVGDDTSWSDGMARGLAQVPSEYMVCLLDDYMLTERVPVQRLTEVYRSLKSRDGNWVCLRPKGAAPASDPEALISPITDPAQSGGFDPGIWRTAYLQKICAEVQLNIWHMEGHIRKLIRSGAAEKLYYMTDNAAKLVSYMEVVKRFWQKKGIDYMRANNIRPDLWRRPYPPQGDNVFARFIRSILKRYVRLMSTLETKRLLKKNNGVVSSAVRFIKPEN